MRNADLSSLSDSDRADALRQAEIADFYARREVEPVYAEPDVSAFRPPQHRINFAHIPDLDGE